MLTAPSRHQALWVATPVLALACTGTTLALPPQPLGNINPGAPVTAGSSSPSHFTRINNNLAYFVATAPTTGTEVYRTDGTAGGTALIKDLSPGSSGGVFSVRIATGVSVPLPKFGSVGGTKAVFFSTTPSTGDEIAVTDGTPAGTFVIDVTPGIIIYITGAPSATALFTANTGELDVALESVDGKAYYAGQDGIHGTTLWVTDGTLTGTRMVTGAAGLNVNPQNNNATPRMYTNIGNGRLLFAANDGQNGLEWFVYDSRIATDYRAPTSAATASANATGNPKRISNLNGPGDGATFWMQPLSVDVGGVQYLYLNCVNSTGVDDQLYRFPMATYSAAVDQTALLTQATNVPGANPVRTQFDAQYVDNGFGQRRVIFIANNGSTGTRIWTHDPEAAIPNATVLTTASSATAQVTFPRRGRIVNDGTRNRCIYWAGSTSRGWELCATDGLTAGGVPAGGAGDPMIRELAAGTASGCGQALPPAINPTPATSVQSLWPVPIYAVADPSGPGITAYFGATNIGTASPVTSPWGPNNAPGQTNAANNPATTSVQLYRSSGTLATTPNTPVAILNPAGGP